MGDFFLVRAGHDTVPLIVYREFGHGALARLLGAGTLDGLEQIGSDAYVTSTPGEAQGFRDMAAIADKINGNAGATAPPGPRLMS